MKTICLLPLTAVLLVAAVTTTAGDDPPRLSLLRTLGSEGDDLFLHNPAAVNFAADGTIYLLNGGECQVLHLDADWNLLQAFGRCGRGPGEFENPVGMVLHRDQIWVFEMARITVYARDGTHLRTIQPGTQYGPPIVLDGQLMAVAGTGDRAVAVLDEDGATVSSLGPQCPDDFFSAFKACHNMQIMPHEDGACLLLNPIDGHAYLVGEDGEVVWDRFLIQRDERSSYSESDDGNEASLTISFNMGLGCRDQAGRYWLAIPDEDEDGPTTLRVTDKELHTLAEYRLPEGIHGWEPIVSPRGRMVVVSPGESVIHLLEMPAEIGKP